VHISELAQQHVENPREIVQPGDDVRVKILEIDSERRRLSLSIKRVEDQILPRRDRQEAEVSSAGDLEDMPELGLSEDVYPETGEHAVVDSEAAAPPAPEAEVEAAPEAEAAAEEPEAAAEPEPEPEAAAEPEPQAESEDEES
jgi:small subunit ribosomal protein S1